MSQNPLECSFREYCARQIGRLGGAFPEFRFYDADARDELVNWLEAKAEGDRDKASGAITEACEFGNLPKIAELNEVWLRLYPKVGNIARPDCEHCAGTGWEIAARGAYEGVRRCRCGGSPPNHKPDEAWETPLTLTVNS